MKFKTNSFHPSIEKLLCQHFGYTEESAKKAYIASADATANAYYPQGTIDYTIEIKILKTNLKFAECYQMDRIFTTSETIERIIPKLENDFAKWLSVHKLAICSTLLRLEDLESMDNYQTQELQTKYDAHKIGEEIQQYVMKIKNIGKSLSRKP